MSKRLTMNNKMKRIFFGFLILMTGMAFYGCSNSSFESAPETPQKGSGYFVLTNGSAETVRAMTIKPETPVVGDFASYELVFSPRGTNSNPQETVNLTSSNLNNPVELPVGTWDLVVYAYKIAGDPLPAAQGDLIGVIDIKSGGTTSGTVSLATFVSGGTGTFSWNITYPPVTSATMEIKLLDGTVVPTPPFTAAGSLSLDSGYYSVLFELTNSTGQTTSLRETLHIHRNMESAFTHTFIPENFFANLSGVSIGVQMGGQPADWTDPCEGETLELVATVTPTLPSSGYKYQWYRGSTPIGTNSATYTFTVTSADVGTTDNFSVTVICDGYNGSVTNSLTLTMEGVPDGSPTDPFRIYDESDLQSVGKEVPPNPTWTPDANYRLMRSINLTSPWEPIYTTAISTHDFTGIFDGGNNTISGLIVNDGSTGYLGLFYQNNGTIKNLGLINVSINSSSIGTQCFGGVAASNGNSGTIQNCFVTGSVTTVGVYTGGIVGQNSGTVENCYSTCNVNVQGAYAGGVVGYNSSYGTVKNCYSTGNVTGNVTDTYHIGGVVGNNNAVNSIVENCYATGVITGNTSGILYGVGGIIGTNAGASGNSVRYCVALNRQLVNGGTEDSVFGRVIGVINPGGTVADNKARADMTGPTSFSDGTEKDGDDITVMGAGTPNSSVFSAGNGWDPTIWDIPAGNLSTTNNALPTLKNMPGPAQNPEMTP